MAKHIALTGMMGSGKSSIAPFLAQSLQREVIELDQLIEYQEGKPISEIFIDSGEAYFRKKERELIQHVMTQPASVISLGGGAFMWEATRVLLLDQAVVFYLSTSEEVLLSRLEANFRTRPLLSIPGTDPRQTIKELIKRRTPFYEQAHFTIETDNFSPQQLAEAIVQYRDEFE